MTNTKPEYWFPAKQYGWGWGPPNTWQGWLVLAVFAVLLLGGAVVLLPGASRIPFLVYTAAISAVLVGVCYLKGEPPAWRWGKD